MYSYRKCCGPAHISFCQCKCNNSVVFKVPTKLFQRKNTKQGAENGTIRFFLSHIAVKL